MKKSILLLSLLFLFASFLFSQAQMTLWRVDETHISNPATGLAYAFDCGDEYYFTFSPSKKDTFIIEIKNEGTAPLTVTIPSIFNTGSSSYLSIVPTATNVTLNAGQETHFKVAYSAPASYPGAENGSLTIQSNDPNHPNCQVNFGIGTIPSAPNFTKAFAPTSIKAGEVSRLTFTIDASGMVGVPTINGLAFTDNLPAGLVIAPTPNITNSCMGGTINGTAGSGVISYSAGMIPFNTTCMIGIDVISNTLGTHMNTNVILSATGRSASSPASANLTVTACINSIAEDPCSCANPLNRRVGGIFLFHDVLKVTGTPSQTLGLAVNDGNFLDVNGVAIPIGTNIPEVPVNSGNYELVFYHPSETATTITTRMNMDMTTDKSFTSSICSESICNPIPTMSSWGLLIFALLLLNLGGYLIIKQIELT